MLNINTTPINQRVRAILLTNDNRLLFIKRVKPNNTPPYWVAPGGGVEDVDQSLFDALHRELYEELGASVEVLEHSFVLRHAKANKNLEEHFFICRLLHYDLELRHGPEFNDPARGQYIPEAVSLTPEALERIELKTEELHHWLLDNLDKLQTM